MSPKKRVPLKEIEVISDPKIIKLMMEPTRAAILKNLAAESMTVKQLSVRLDKNPGTILHHIEKLKDPKVGLVVEVRTEQTPTGIVQRYYRARAREFRLGIKGMMQTDSGVAKFAEDRLKTLVRTLSVFGINIPESQQAEAAEMLRELVERENTVISNMPIIDQDGHDKLSSQDRTDATMILRRYILDRDPKYVELRREWHRFLSHYNQGA
ncbi:MAG: helix-turn-helix domain-containing protein [Candidatus Thorarchaeota archaeon]|nr:helix-turn-helix domain-containing protein [Candidatus Thorarchaeota archaeon]